MNKKRAKEIILAHACCSFTNIENKLCEKCPWNNKEDCEKTMIDVKLITEAIIAINC